MQFCRRPFLICSLFRADFLSAIIFKTELIYTPVDNRQQQHPTYEPLKSPLVSPGLFSAQPEQSDLSAEAIRILNNMHKLTCMFEYLNNNAVTPVFDPSTMEASFKHLQPSSSPCRRTNYISDNLHESLRLTGWIYYRALVCNVPFSDNANLEDAVRLKITIEATVLTGWIDIPGALLWVLLVGTAALRGKPEGFVVSGHLSTSALCVGVRHWLPVRRMLEKFVVLEKMVEENANNMRKQFNEFRRTSETSDSDDVDSEVLEGEVIGMVDEDAIDMKDLAGHQGIHRRANECKIVDDPDDADELSFLEGEVMGMLT